MAPNAARRMDTWLYKVDVTASEPTSEYLFYPNPGAIYWLGDLSPDNQKVAVFELNHDDNSVRAGVWHLEEEEKIQWFEPRPDEGTFGGATAWISDDEFLYYAKEGDVKLIRANAATGKAEPCAECSEETVRKAENADQVARAAEKKTASKIEAPDLPEGARLIAGAANGDLAIYAKDDRDVLMLIYKQPGRPVEVLFGNKRLRVRPESKAVDAEAKKDSSEGDGTAQ